MNMQTTVLPLQVAPVQPHGQRQTYEIMTRTHVPPLLHGGTQLVGDDAEKTTTSCTKTCLKCSTINSDAECEQLYTRKDTHKKGYILNNAVKRNTASYILVLID